MKNILLLFLFFAFSSKLFAQEPKESDPKKLDELVVKEKRKTAKERGEFKRHAQTVRLSPKKN